MQLPPEDQASPPTAAGLPPGPPVAAIRHAGAIERVAALLDAYRSARQQPMLGLMDWWVLTAPDKAGAWLARFPSSANLDPVVDRFARDLARHDPTAAADWAATITDPA